MDCEKFDQHVIDALYEELDELTAAALKRHIEGCTRCAQIFAGLKSAREAAALPLEEPSFDLEARIMAAEKATLRRAPWYFKVMRGAAFAGSLAMRPQFAMAALFMLVVGSSLLLLRARPGTIGSPVQVTQRGEPGPAGDSEEHAKREPRGDSPPKSAAGAAARDEGIAGRPREDSAESKDKSPERTQLDGASSSAPTAPPAPAATAEASASAAVVGGGPGAAGELATARNLRAQGGCSAAIQQYDAVAKNYPSTPEAHAAKLEAADCSRELSKGKPSDPSKAASPSAPH